MKFTKHQKKTIELIASREIFDIRSYIEYFGYGKTIKYNKEMVKENFSKSCKEPLYYQVVNNQPSENSTMSMKKYKELLRSGEISSEEYTQKQLTIDYDVGIQEKNLQGEKYNFDFYEGVYIAKAFENILEFLVLWEFLKSQMLILEINTSSLKENIELLFVKDNTIKNSSTEYAKGIDYKTLTVSDSYFIDEDTYALSYENLSICEKFLSKKLIPSASLSIFIKNNFKSQEERIQIKALWAAWIAIFVSIILTILPFFFTNNSEELQITNSIYEHVSKFNVITSEFFKEQKEFNEKIEGYLFANANEENNECLNRGEETTAKETIAK